MRGSQRGDPAAHAVARDHDALCVDAELAGVRGIGEVREHGVRVLEIVAESELAGAPPRAAVVERNRVPASAPYRLREVDVLLVAGQYVEEHEGGVSPRP